MRGATQAETQPSIGWTALTPRGTRSAPGRAIWGLLVLLIAIGCDRRQSVFRLSIPSSTPVQGGNLRMRIPPPLTLDPALADFEHESCVINQIFDGLVELDRDHAPKPAIASYWTRGPHRRTYTFYLRQDAKFHHGRTVTARDFIFTYERILRMESEKSTASDLLLHLAGAEAYAAFERDTVTGLSAPDDFTLIMELEEPVANYPTLLANDGLGVVPREIVEESDDFGRRPVGTGPFRFESWTRKAITLLRNGDYFGKPPYLETLQLELSESDLGMSTIDALLDNTLDFAPCDPSQAAHVTDLVNVHNWDNSLIYLACNVSREPLDNPLVRRAIGHALNRSRLVNSDFSGLEPSRSIIPRGLFGFSLETNAPEFDPDTAKRLLSEAGYPGGEGLGDINLWTFAHSQLEDYIVEDLQNVGIPCRLRIVHFSRFERRVKQGHAKLFILPFAFSVADGSYMLRRLFHTDGGYNLFSYSNENIDSLFDDAQGLEDSRLRYHQCEEIQARLLQDSPVIPLLLTRNTYAARKVVRDLKPGPFGLSSLKLEFAWLDQK